MNDNGPDTVRIPKIGELNELEYAQIKYDEAVKSYLAHPSYENRAIFLKANARLIETRYAYNKGAELIRQYHVSHLGYGSQDLRAL